MYPPESSSKCWVDIRRYLKLAQLSGLIYSQLHRLKEEEHDYSTSWLCFGRGKNQKACFLRGF